MPFAALGPILAGAAGTSAAATAGAWGALGLGATTAGNLIGANINSNAAQAAANQNAAAAKYAADLQHQATEDTLAFDKQQLAQAEQDFQQTQHANYDQQRAAAQNLYNWSAARDQRLGTLAQRLGAAPRTTPAFNYPDYVGPQPGSLALPTTPANPPPSVPSAQGGQGAGGTGIGNPGSTGPAMSAGPSLAMNAAPAPAQTLAPSQPPMWVRGPDGKWMLQGMTR